MERLWFKAKQYGWGWYPVTWEGWSVIAVYLLFLWTVIHGSQAIFGQKHFIIPYLTGVATLTTILLIVCFKTGEKPEWRWGPKIKKKQKRRY
jgi:hypothetical protein